MTWARGWSLRTGLLMAVLAGYLALSLGVAALQVVNRLEDALRDAITQAMAREAPEHRVVLVDIDETSLQRLGPWPWPRLRLAELVGGLRHGLGTGPVALDMVLPDARDPQGDAALLELASQGELVLSEVLSLDPRAAANRVGRLSEGEPARGNEPMAYGHLANHAGLSRAPCIGNIGFEPDEDGTLRRMPLWTQLEGRRYPTLALAMLRCGQPARPIADLPSEVRLRFLNADRSWLVIPAAAVLQPTAEERDLLAALAPDLMGRYVLVGSSALGLADRVSTPLSSSTSGVLVHAHLLTELLDARHSRAQATQGLGGLALGAVSLLLLWLSLAVVSTRRALGVGLLFAGGFSLGLAFWWGHVDNSPYALGAAPLCFLALLLAQGASEWMRIRGQARAVTGLLRRYVSPEVLKAVIATSNAQVLAPKRTRITVLVVDMVGYTRATAGLSLPEAARFTQTFIEAITPAVLHHGGTLDRYTGDGLVAFWGAPLDDPQAADHAVSAACAVQRMARDQLGVEVRLGIASGEGLVGDFGSGHRAHYTAVGTCINLAARLEAYCKDLNRSLLFDASTAEGLARFTPTELGTHEIKGIGPVALYTLSDCTQSS